MREVLISIQPRWVEKIVSGEKTVEVRKTKPKCETPFKCYIYETKGYDTLFGKGKPKKLCVSGGRVVAEFVCDRISEYECSSKGHGELATTCGTCLTYDEIINYCNGNELYGWHITDLIVYDEPRELSEFSSVEKKSCPAYLNGICLDRTQNQVIRCEHLDCEHKKITRSPQSWQFCVATEPRQTAD